jgi:hypothetical protein
MTDLDVALHRVLHDLADTTVNSTSNAPNESDVARRVRRHRSNRRGGGAAVVLVLLSGVAIWRVEPARVRTTRITTPPVSSTLAAVPATTTTAPTATTASIIPAPTTSSPVDLTTGGYSIVFARGESLVEVNENGQERVVAPLPGPATGSGIDPIVRGSGNHLMVTYLGRVFTFERGSWESALAGDFFNMGFVATRDGFWAQERNESGPWRRFGWQGENIGPPVDGTELSIPFGAVDGAIALWTFATSHVVVADVKGANDLGPGRAVAAGTAGVAFRSPDGNLILYDPTTRNRRVLTNLGDLGPIQTTGAGAFSEDGSRLAIALSPNNDTFGPTAVLVVDLNSGDTTRLTLEPHAVAVAWLPDGSSLIARTQTALYLVEPATGVSRLLADDVWGDFAILGT